MRLPGGEVSLAWLRRLSDSPFSAEQGLAHRWFANLLPEAGARQALVRRLGVVDEDIALLAAIGGDCAGALSLLPDGSGTSLKPA